MLSLEVGTKCSDQDLTPFAKINLVDRSIAGRQRPNGQALTQYSQKYDYFTISYVCAISVGRPERFLFKRNLSTSKLGQVFPGRAFFDRPLLPKTRSRSGKQTVLLESGYRPARLARTWNGARHR